MKVVGTGSPIMLTIRVTSSEVGLLRDVVCEHRALVLESGGERLLGPGRRSSGETDSEDACDELVVLTRLLDQLRQPVVAGQPREMVGPTWLVDPIVRSAATVAVERLSEAVDAFRSDTGKLTADELRAVLATACACTSTLIGLDHAQNYGVS